MLDFAKRTTLAAVAALSFAMPSAAVVAAGYPEKPIKIVVAYPAGGDSDVLARWIGEKLTAKWGQPVVVENRSGAAGSIGSAYVARSPADGYTLLLAPNTLAIVPHVLKPGTGAQYNAQADFTPIVEIGTQSLFLASSQQSGVASVKEMVEAVKAGRLQSYASPGSGSPMHILAELFDKAAGTRITQIPYRGSAPAIVDLVGGQVPLMYTTLGPIVSYVAEGKLRLLAVADAQRSPFAPDVPTFTELGYKNVEVGAWQALLGPRGLPADVVQKLNAAVNEIIKMPDIVSRTQVMGLTLTGGAPETLARRIAAEDTRYARLIKEFGIQAN
ncbi:tripartite tricarboxylate transporter substrate binding protein [uncultured Pigmentiphaga sp.]|mgnify:CR=1 FL=1|uniref:Bug family tripartite tricarboxylate transporter substrate binding protein n=2 Tax=Pigmentiphaga TaxID=152267 RepID=UPI002639FA03|nr:tripartite tricarboxylate transporter substrate binding protein [uncultured Pigmentiphaga sp.]